MSDCTCTDVETYIKVVLEGGDPAEYPCPLHDPAPAPESSVALNDDKSLAAIVGAPLNKNDAAAAAFAAALAAADPDPTPA
jgi:hypothetical protein